MIVTPSDALSRLPPYPFAELEKKAESLRGRGIDMIDLSIGDPDLPPPVEILDTLAEAASDPANHRYSTSRGEVFLRQAISAWYRVRFGVEVDSEREVCVLAGSKEGLVNMPRAIANPDDIVLVPNPGYPVYANGAALLSGFRPVEINLDPCTGYLPDLSVCHGIGAKFIYLNYPNNPTGAVAPKEFLKEVVDFALDEGLIVCYDNAYSELSFVGPQHSILEIPNGIECAVEFHSISKTFSMPGDRLGFVVGSEQVIENLVELKSQVDSGCPVYVQATAARALGMFKSRSPPPCVRRNLRIYEERMTAAARSLLDCGFSCTPSAGTFYLWVHVGNGTREFVNDALDAGVQLTPGAAFGSAGQPFVRFAMTKPIDRIVEAVERIRAMTQSAPG